MAGETIKSAALTARDGGQYRQARLNKARPRVGLDVFTFTAASQLEIGDNLILDIPIPSNSTILGVSSMHGDLDTGTPTLTVNIGLAAREQFESFTGGTKTIHLEDEILDGDLLVSAATDFQSAVTKYTTLASAVSAANISKPLYELLGYDEDPGTTFNIVFQVQAATDALASPASVTLKVEYTVD